jgi:hypothetical protein
MALGDNTAFFNETTFYLADEQTSVTGVSGIKVSDASAAKVLFTNLDYLFNSVTVTTSAVIGNIEYELDIDTAYDSQLIAVINSDRLATQFTFASGASSDFQTASATGNNSVGPTLRRLYHLGYV